LIVIIADVVIKAKVTIVAIIKLIIVI